MTTCDLLASPALVKDARREFDATEDAPAASR